MHYVPFALASLYKGRSFMLETIQHRALSSAAVRCHRNEEEGRGKGESQEEVMEERKVAMDNNRDEVVETVAEEEEDVALPGFRFHPTDEELVGFYLRRKVERKPISIEIIKQVDIYKYDPWDLSRVSNVGDKEWYFFCLRGRKYRNSIRPNRVTGSGFWKATGIDRPIYAASENNNCVGLKKSLVYYRGSAGKGTKTDWMMHEFRLPPASASSGKINGANNSCIQEGETWTICRIFKRTVSYKRHAQAHLPNTYTSTKHVLTGMSSKSCSAGSISDHDYKQLLVSTSQQSDSNSVITCYEDMVQSYACQWNSPPTQAPSPASNLGFPVWTPNDFLYRDGSWDEFGRTEEVPVDPFLVYDCRL